MVRDVIADGMTPDPASAAGAVADEPAKAANALLRRAEQLKRWEESETNKLTLPPDGGAAAASQRPRRVTFPEHCVFLAACVGGDLDEVKAMLEKGADVNTANVDGLTALHQAVIDENAEMVDFLVARGADLDAQDNEGWTPLMAGVSCDFVDVVRRLLANGADPVLPNNDGEMPVDLAESDEMRRLLDEEIRKKGIDLEEVRNREEKQMIDDAVAWASSVKITKETRHPVTGATAVHVAAAKGYCNVLRILLPAGADVNAKDNDGWTPLHAAAHWGEREACEMLVEYSANVEELNHSGCDCVDVADPELIPFLEAAKEKQKSLSANVNKSSIVSKFSAPAAPLAAVDPAMPPPTPPSTVQLPAWRLTGRRAPTMSAAAPATVRAAAAEPTRSPPPSDPNPTRRSRFNGSDVETTSGTGTVPGTGPGVGAGPASVSCPTPPSTIQRSSIAAAVREPPAPTSAPPDRSRLKPEPDPPTGRPVVADSIAQPQAPPSRPRLNELPSTPSLISPTAGDEKSRTGTPTSAAQRADESESERKLRAKRERESRRSTQGVTLEAFKAAEQMIADRGVAKSAVTPPSSKKAPEAPIFLKVASYGPENVAQKLQQQQQPDPALISSLKVLDELASPAANSVSFKSTAAGRRPLTSGGGAVRHPAKEPNPKSATELPSERDKVAPKTQLNPSNGPATDHRITGSGIGSIAFAARNSALLVMETGSGAGSGVPNGTAPEQRNGTGAGGTRTDPTRAPRRNRCSRRSTGPIDQDEVHAASLGDQPKEPIEPDYGSNAGPAIRATGSPEPDRNKGASSDSRPATRPLYNCSNLSDYRNNRPAAYVTNATTAASSLNDRFLRSSSVVSTSSPPGSGGDSDSVDYKKLYEKEVAENERLRKIIADLEKSIDGIKFGVKQASGDGCHIIPYNHNRIEKLVSELEGENRNLDQIRAENIKLKEENGALIRVISKLSKSK